MLSKSLISTLDQTLVKESICFLLEYPSNSETTALLSQNFTFWTIEAYFQNYHGFDAPRYLQNTVYAPIDRILPPR